MVSPKENSESMKATTELDFMRLYAGKERVIYKYIYTLVHDESVAEDLLQETAQVLWTKFSEFEPGTNFVAWALTVAHYRILNYRSANTHRMIFSSELVDALAQRAQETIYQDAPRKSALRHCLEKLSRQDRQLIELRYMEETTVKGIAQRVGRNLKGVYQSLNRIRWNLMLCIQRTLAVEERP